VCFHSDHMFHRIAGSKPKAQYSVQEHAHHISSAITNASGRALAQVLSLRDSEHVSLLFNSLPQQATQYPGQELYLQEYRRALSSAEFQYAGSSPWSVIASKHVAVVVHVSQTELDQETRLERPTPAWIDAFSVQLEMVK